MAKSIIQQYINLRSNSAIRSRANSVNILEMEIADDQKTATFVVQGSQGAKYNVKIYKINTPFMFTNCTCPYDWGGLCKHEVATLRQLDDDIQVTVIKSTPKAKDLVQFNSIDPYIIKNSKVITKDLIYEHSGTNFYQHYPNLEIGVIALGENFFDLMVPENINYHYETKHKKVEIIHNGASLSIKCSCKKTNKSLCQHQAWALFFIIDQFSPQYFDKDYKERIWKEGLAQYGYTPSESSKKLFDLKYVQGQLKVVPLVKGLISNAENFENLARSLALTRDNNAQPWFLKQEVAKKKDKFGFNIGINFSNFHNTRPEVHLLEGKLNKAGEISSHITSIDGLDEIRDEGDIESSLGLLKMVKATTGYSHYESESAKKQNPQGYMQEAQPRLDHLTKLINEYYDKIPFVEMSHGQYQLTKRYLKPISIVKNATSLSFVFSEEEAFFKLKAFLTVEGNKVPMERGIGISDDYFILYKDKYYLHPSIEFAVTFDYFQKHNVQRITKVGKADFLQNFLIPLQKKYPVKFQTDSIVVKRKKLNPSQIQKRMYLTELEGHILFRPMIGKGDMETELFGNANFTEQKGKTLTHFDIDETLLTSYRELMANMHPNFELQVQHGECYLTFEEFRHKQWFLDAFEQLKNQEVEIFGLNTFKSMNYNTSRPTINTEVSSGLDWFEVNMNITFGDASISLKEVRKAIFKQQSFVQLDDGTVGFLPEEWLQKMEKNFRFGEIEDDNLRVSKHHFSIIDEWFDELDDEDIKLEIAEKKQKLLHFDKIKQIKVPTKIKADLRDYQMHGFNWMGFLDEFNWGGCLADDMGLGKTLQVITLLRHQKDKKIKEPSLVVVPTSLIFNWQAEIAKFCPSLKVMTIEGSNRKKSTVGFGKLDVILISYGLILRDVEYLKKYKFNYIILDESQAIKNPTSKRYKTVRLLQGRNRLVMTGTPVENSTLDLYSQMSFANPGLLGNLSFFKDYFVKPIEKDKDNAKAAELNRLIKPFMIRRTKEQVATELPEKTEMTLHCEMESAQQKVYDAYRNKYRDYLMGKIEENGLQSSKIYVLEGLLKLRQICNSPALLADEEDYGDEAIKIKELMNHVTEKTGQHKILIFSQFVTMLRLIENGLKKAEIKYEYLDGSTKNRQERVDNFEDNDEIRVFLISLKAGGTGLNLTSADYVYIVDPWWNPAVEAQAIDRCYRIGQEKHVIAYKMICKNTVEEKIVELQQRKKKLVTQIVTTDDNVLKSLTKTDIAQLFS